MTPLYSPKAPRLPLWSGSLLTAFVFCYGRPRAAVLSCLQPVARRAASVAACFKVLGG